MSDLPSANRFVYDFDFLEDAYNELPYHMQQKSNLVKMLLVFANRLDKVQQEAVNIGYYRFIDNAEGVVLDAIADRLFVDRVNQSDQSLKAAIKLRALSQDSEGTREDIYKMFDIISNGQPVKIYKGGKKYIEVTFPTDCLDVSQIKLNLSDLFPVNANVAIGSNVTGSLIFGGGSVFDEDTDDELPYLIGQTASVFDSASDYDQKLATLVVSDERDYGG